MGTKVLLYGWFSTPAKPGVESELYRFDGIDVAAYDAGVFTVELHPSVLDFDGVSREITERLEVVPVHFSQSPDGAPAMAVRIDDFSAQISLPGVFGYASVVDVYLPCSRYGGALKPSQVNWSACGAQEPGTAQVFGAALQLACRLSVEFDEAAGLI